MIPRGFMIDFHKLRAEWKTFALAVFTSVVGLWDTIANSGYDITPIIPDKYRPMAVPCIGISFLLLRKYSNVGNIK